MLMNPDMGGVFIKGSGHWLISQEDRVALPKLVDFLEK
jgi:hypothetical protein